MPGMVGPALHMCHFAAWGADADNGEERDGAGTAVPANAGIISSALYVCQWMCCVKSAGGDNGGKEGAAGQLHQDR